MRIVHISYYFGNNTSGAPVAATRLHLSLLNAGVDSHFICVKAKGVGPNVYQLPSVRWLNILFYIVTRGIWVISKMLFGRILMANILPLWGFNSLVSKLKPDVIHIHLLSLDMLSFSQIKKLKVPCVYTLHDLTAVIATDTHPWHDSRYVVGYTKSNSTVVERWMFSRKKSFVDATKPLFTGPSHWVCKLFSESLIGRNREVVQIPNVNDSTFRYDPNNISPHKDFVMLFGAFGGRKSKFKGWEDLMAAISLLPNDVRNSSIIYVFGENHPDCIESGIRIHFLGEINSPVDLNMVYHSSDIFVLPSRQDNAPQVKFEAFACGLPVVSFGRAGCHEFIDSGRNGWVAKDGDIDGYMHGICFWYNKFKTEGLRQTRKAISDWYLDSFSQNRIVGNYCDTYTKCMGRSE